MPSSFTVSFLLFLFSVFSELLRLLEVCCFAQLEQSVLDIRCQVVLAINLLVLAHVVEEDVDGLGVDLRHLLHIVDLSVLQLLT